MSTHIEKEEKLFDEKFDTFIVGVKYIRDPVDGKYPIERSSFTEKDVKSHLRTSLTRTLEVVEKWGNDNAFPNDRQYEPANRTIRLVDLLAFIRDLKR